jgi:hypothetical protein
VEYRKRMRMKKTKKEKKKRKGRTLKLIHKLQRSEFRMFLK